MKIERISIVSFGRLTDFDLTLSDGINVLEGANESGKSTIAAFIPVSWLLVLTVVFQLCSGLHYFLCKELQTNT